MAANSSDDGTMQKIGIALGAAVMAVGGILLILPIGTFFGGVAGCGVGLFFGYTILGIAGQLGVKGVTMFQIGAFLGFVGAFLRTKVSTEASKK